MNHPHLVATFSRENGHLLGTPRSQVHSHKWRFRLGFPIKNVLILVVIVTGWGDNPSHPPKTHFHNTHRPVNDACKTPAPHFIPSSAAPCSPKPRPCWNCHWWSEYQPEKTATPRKMNLGWSCCEQRIWISLRIQHDDDDDYYYYYYCDYNDYSCYSFTKLPNLFFHVPCRLDALFLPTFAKSMLKWTFEKAIKVIHHGKFHLIGGFFSKPLVKYDVHVKMGIMIPPGQKILENLWEAII